MIIGLGIVYLFKSMGALVLVLFLANVALKQLNRTMAKQQRVIHILERLSVGKNASLAIAKVGESYYLMSLSDSQSTILKELTEEEVEVALHKETDLEKPKETDTIVSKLPSIVQEIWAPIEKRLKP